MRVSLLGRSGARMRRRLLPLYLEHVSAGFPSPAQDYIEKALDLNELCIRHPAATYYVRVQGDSMIEAGIYSGDILIVDRSLTAKHGDIVIAALHGEFTVKELQLHPTPCLLPRNKRYKPIDAPEIEVFGVVSGVVRILNR
ncbi:translesion error-prone DNA polymerase V autoproteolytic subunit [Hahella sp. NBU794]|uniref:translesion error-prone DNA polymerase V autoproteolytic subunit n=1 Tax=Hahella sp. NBU794 TaxID=3422590 RepID=UPI003D6E1448